MPIPSPPVSLAESGCAFPSPRSTVNGLFLGFSDNGDDQAIGTQQPLGDPLEVIEGDRLDQIVALVDIVDPKILQLDPKHLARNLDARIEAQSVGPGQILFGVFEVLRTWSLFGHALELLANDVDRAANRLVLRRHASRIDRGVSEGRQIAEDRVGQAPLFAHLFRETRRETATAGRILQDRRA